MTKFTKDPSTHPANGPLTEERLIRVRDELASSLDYAEGSNRDRMIADALKAIIELLERRAAPQLPQPVVGDGRAEFEAWMLKKWGRERQEYDFIMAPTISGQDYGDSYTRCMWKAWSASRAAVLQSAEPVRQTNKLPDWQAEAEKMAELHGSSFVVFRSGAAPQCADPSKVVISFTDEGLGHGSAAPQQEADNG